MMPPRHGKSELVSKYLPAWWMMMRPDDQILLASYEADFAAQWGRRARDLVEDHGHLFGVKVNQESHAANRWNIAGREGAMHTAGVRGPITGKGANCAIIDDPVKNDEEASSETYRERTWEWYLSTFSTRLHRGASIVIIMTRWNEDDLVGRILKAQLAGGEQWKILRLPAIAEEDEHVPPLWERKAGRALCPDLIPEAMLLETEKRLGTYWWSSLYQQRPFPRGGGIFRRADFEIVHAKPNTTIRCRAWDLAASTKKDAKRTAGILLSKNYEGKFYVEDVVSGKWLPGDRDRVVEQTAHRDGKSVPVRIEQEGGSGGIAQVEALVRRLVGFDCRGVPVTGDKVTRADPVAAQSNVRNICLVAGPWNETFLSEIESFPKGEYLDQVDALSMAFSEIATRTAGPRLAAKFPKDWRDEYQEQRSEYRPQRDWRTYFPSDQAE